MSLHRIIAIVIIYLLATAGWGILGTASWVRSQAKGTELGEEIAELYGQELIQRAPRIAVLDADGAAEETLAEGATVRVALDYDPRQKGLIWYPTYRCSFEATYRLANPSATERRYRLHFNFPDPQATYDAFAVLIDDEPLVEAVDTRAGLQVELVVPPGGERRFGVGYRTRGLGQWRYSPTAGLGRVRGLDCQVQTNFANVDFPEGSLSPMQLERSDESASLHWTASDLITRQDIAVSVPQPLNPGPVTARITYFAPVCLGFFFLLVATVTIVRPVPIHPMHYIFVAGGFFAFHLLLAYLIDHLSMHLAFILAAATSLGLTTTYLRSALGARFPTGWVLAAQAFFLVLFSYSFFYPGFTGLTVAVGSVVTLAVLMRVTAGVDWTVFFHPPGSTVACASTANEGEELNIDGDIVDDSDDAEDSSAPLVR